MTNQDRDMEMQNRSGSSSDPSTSDESGGQGQGSATGQGNQGDSGVMGGESWQDRNRQPSGSEDEDTSMGDTSMSGHEDQTSRS